MSGLEYNAILQIFKFFYKRNSFIHNSSFLKISCLKMFTSIPLKLINPSYCSNIIYN